MTHKQRAARAALFKAMALYAVPIGAILAFSHDTRAAAPTDLVIRAATRPLRVGTPGSVRLTVINIGSAATDDIIQVSIDLPDGLSFVSSGGWPCSVAGQAVTCTDGEPLPPGTAARITLNVNVGAAALPTVTNVASLSYAGDTNPANNTARRPTVVRRGLRMPPATTATPVPAGMPTPTPTPTAQPGSTIAPVVTSFTCKGGTQCAVATDESFPVRFSVTDADADAISWRIIARRDDGFSRQLGQGDLGMPTGSATVPLQWPAFTCSFAHCRQDVWTFTLTVSDTSGLTSAPVSITITVLAS